MPGQCLSLDFFGPRAACCLADLCHKRFGDDCLGGLFGDGVTGIWIGLKIGYHQNGYYMWKHDFPILLLLFFLVPVLHLFDLWLVYIYYSILHILT